jgi:hypothetical protein
MNCSDAINDTVIVLGCASVPTLQAVDGETYGKSVTHDDDQDTAADNPHEEEEEEEEDVPPPAPAPVPTRGTPAADIAAAMAAARAAQEAQAAAAPPAPPLAPRVPPERVALEQAAPGPGRRSAQRGSEARSSGGFTHQQMQPQPLGYAPNPLHQMQQVAATHLDEFTQVAGAKPAKKRGK